MVQGTTVISGLCFATAGYLLFSLTGTGGLSDPSISLQLGLDPALPFAGQQEQGIGPQGLRIEPNSATTIAQAIGLIVAGIVIIVLSNLSRSRLQPGNSSDPAQERSLVTRHANDQRQFPNEIWLDPFSDELEYVKLDAKISVAIQTSLQLGRYLGTIFLPFTNDQAENATAAENQARAREFAAKIRDSLRKHDGVSVLDDGLLLVAAKMKSPANLEKIARRAAEFATRHAGQYPACALARPAAQPIRLTAMLPQTLSPPPGRAPRSIPRRVLSYGQDRRQI